MTRTQAAFAALRTVDPAAEITDALDDRARADLARILAAPRQETPAARAAPSRRAPARRRPRRALVAGLALAGLTAAALVAPSVLPSVPGSDRPAYAATPDPLTVLPARAFAEAGLDPDGDADALLSSIADRAQSRRDRSATGAYAKMSSEGWSLWTTVDGNRVTSRVVPQTTTTWTAPDGSGRSVTEQDGERAEQSYGPGGRSLMWPLRSLSPDPAVLAGQLERAHPVSNGPAERLVAVTDLVAEQPLAPGARAAVLRYLAATPGLAVTGMVVDRAGRTGLAVHVDTTMSGLPERRTVVVDPTTGAVLAAETELTKTAGALNVQVPAVISYTTFLSAGFTDITS